MTTVKRNGKVMSVPAGLAVSGAISMGITLGLTLWIAHLLDTEGITWIQAGYWILAMLFVSAFLGAKGAIAALKRQRFLVSIMSGGLYWGCLLCTTALFFGGNYDAVPETAGVIIAGSACAAMVSSSGKKKRRAGGKHRKL